MAALGGGTPVQIGAECIALWESLIGRCVLKKKLVPKMLETLRNHSRILVKYRKMLV